MLDVFDIYEPETVTEAIEMLTHFGDEAAIYAGGTELLLLMKEGLVHYPHLIDIKTIRLLDAITVDSAEQTLQIGSLATHYALEHSPLVRRHAPTLGEVESQIANVRVRVAGTIGGNLCFAEPHSDLATLLLAWGGSLHLDGPRGTRQVPIDEFFLGFLETTRQADEILTRITIPLLEKGRAGAYEKFSLHERPMATAASFLALKNEVIQDARLVIGSVGPAPIRVIAAEAMLDGEHPSAELFAAAGECARNATEATDDIYGSAEYKSHLACVLSKRALTCAASSAQGAFDE